ncbi:Tyrosine recombinase XerD [Candidatus Methanoperedenaceae archaeon GB37]|nr:Tyrosine recombinase XerD [Candidatus Methanoperedenaceae archaeon GB37]
MFYERAKEADIPKDLAHPHILRHTRAIELLRAGVPVTIVQDLLGHSALTTTAVYLRISGQEARGF